MTDFDIELGFLRHSKLNFAESGIDMDDMVFSRVIMYY